MTRRRALVLSALVVLALVLARRGLHGHARETAPHMPAGLAPSPASYQGAPPLSGPAPFKARAATAAPPESVEGEPGGMGPGPFASWAKRKIDLVDTTRPLVIEETETAADYMDLPTETRARVVRYVGTVLDAQRSLWAGVSTEAEGTEAIRRAALLARAYDAAMARELGPAGWARMGRLTDAARAGRSLAEADGPGPVDPRPAPPPSEFDRLFLK